MPTIDILNVETLTKNADTDLFSPFLDPISFRVELDLAAALASVKKPILTSSWQIIELYTNQVVETWRISSPPVAPSILWWIDLPTANQLGLNWLRSDVFGFRFAVEMFDDQPPNGWVPVKGALAVSHVKWFRFMDQYAL